MFENLQKWIDEYSNSSQSPYGEVKQAIPKANEKPSQEKTTRTSSISTISTSSRSPVSCLSDIGRAFQSSLLQDKQYDPNVAPDQLEALVYKEVLLNIKQGVKPEDLPRQPTIMTELLKRIEDEHSTYHDIVDLINKEPALATQVLKEANSPLYHVSDDPIASIEQAVGMLGLRRLNAITITILMQDTFNISPIYFKHFSKYLWKHSLDCANISSKLAERSGADPFAAYLIGLIHDIGKLVIFQKLMKALKSSHPDLQPNPSQLAKIIDKTAMQLSCVSLKHWELPIDVQIAICQQAKVIDAEQLPEKAYILYCANLLSEIQLLINDGKLSREEADELLHQQGLEADVFEFINSK